MSIDINKYEGSIFACQLALKMLMEDTTNHFIQRKNAETIYEWLGWIECSIDELCYVSYDKSLFILKALEKYNSTKIFESNIVFFYDDAMNSLKYQINNMQKK